MTLETLLRGVELIRCPLSPETEIASVVSDSRRAAPGCLFLALPGTRTDGHRFLADAAARGAAAAVIDVHHTPPDGLPAICVADTRVAAAHIWNNYFDDPSRTMRTVAVTGTNGKTTTSTMLHAILCRAGFMPGLIGTVQCLCGTSPIDIGAGGEIVDTPAAMTTPDPEYLTGAIAQMHRRGADALVLEASSHALSFHKIDALRLDLGVFTNLSPEHLDHHGTMDAYRRAKARLFTLVPAGILNADDAAAASIQNDAPFCRFTRCSPGGNPADVRAERVRLLGMDGVEYIYFAQNTVFRVRCPIPGRFTVENSLLAITAALSLGVDPLTVQEAIAAFPGVAGRMERVTLPGAPFSLFIDYAHTPAALEALLRTVRAARAPGQRITLLFGCGGDRDATKRPVMGRIASALADFVIVTSDNPRREDPGEILSAILSGMDREKPHAVIVDRRDAIAYAVTHAEQDEILLFVGKGHESYEITATGKTPFDEAELARAAWAHR